MDKRNAMSPYVGPLLGHENEGGGGGTAYSVRGLENSAV